MSYDVRGLIIWISLILLVVALLFCAHGFRRLRGRHEPSIRGNVPGGAPEQVAPAGSGGSMMSLAVPGVIACLLLVVVVWTYLH